jgi:hypothetical protein
MKPVYIIEQELCEGEGGFQTSDTVQPMAYVNNYIDTNANCHHLNKFTCKGTLRQVFSKVYRLEIQSVILTFSTQLCELLSLSSSLWLTSPPPLPPSLCVHVYSVYGGYEILGLRQINTCRKVLLQANFLKTFCIAFYESYLFTVQPRIQ